MFWRAPWLTFENFDKEWRKGEKLFLDGLDGKSVTITLQVSVSTLYVMDAARIL